MTIFYVKVKRYSMCTPTCVASLFQMNYFFCTHKRRHLLYMHICIYDNVVSQFDNYNFTNLMKMYLFHTFSLKSYNSTILICPD